MDFHGIIYCNFLRNSKNTSCIRLLICNEFLVSLVQTVNSAEWRSFTLGAL